MKPISPNSGEHPWSSIIPDKTPYGKALASQVIARLRNSPVIPEIQVAACCLNAHRDYCGQALIFDPRDESIAVVEVFDGYPQEKLCEFKNRKKAVTWLASQSDFTMGGFQPDHALYAADSFSRGNQRISREGLLAFLRG